jgi:hypothetical protein
MSRTARQILLQRRLGCETVMEAEQLAPFSPDHRVYPQGWSWAHIEREATRRFQFAHDRDRAQDWTWAVDELFERGRIGSDAKAAAHKLYNRLERSELGAVSDTPGDGDGDEHTRLWDREVSRSIVAAAWGWVMHTHGLTPAREAVFWVLFNLRAPSLPLVRVHGRPGGPRRNAKGAMIRMNERETIERCQWAVETVAEFFYDRDQIFGRAA